jgi:hypothetical protein
MIDFLQGLVCKNDFIYSLAKNIHTFLKDRKSYILRQKKIKQFEEQCRDIFFKKLNHKIDGTILVFGSDWPEFIVVQCFLLKAFEKIGLRPIIIQGHNSRKLYRAFGYSNFINLYQYKPYSRKKEALDVLQKIDTQEQLLEFTWHNVRCGKYAASSAMRRLRQGQLDFAKEEVFSCLLQKLEFSMSCAEAANKIIDKFQPEAMLFVDRGYSPEGEFFNVCINYEISCYTWNAAHKNNTLMLKKYVKENSNIHPSSLSSKSWETLCQIPWDESKKRDVYKELEFCYKSGQWYSGAGTQIKRQFVEKSELIRLLQLDSDKKIAAIFPHIFWDASFFWGEDLFDNYEDWFIQTVKAACQNTNISWIIKIHPANIVKDKRDGINGERSEIKAIKKVIGHLPSHIKLLDADYKVSTWSLLSLIDYCITVRGTVGIEAALLGKTVLTSGTGRYDRKGFTLDFETKEEYLNCLKHLQNIQSPDLRQVELAQRFAYGVFCCRPLHLKTLKMYFLSDEKASLAVEILPTTFDEFTKMKDLLEISKWIESGDEDFFSCSSDFKRN